MSLVICFVYVSTLPTWSACGKSKQGRHGVREGTWPSDKLCAVLRSAEIGKRFMMVYKMLLLFFRANPRLSMLSEIPQKQRVNINETTFTAEAISVLISFANGQKFLFLTLIFYVALKKIWKFRGEQIKKLVRRILEVAATIMFETLSRMLSCIFQPNFSAFAVLCCFIDGHIYGMTNGCKFPWTWLKFYRFMSPGNAVRPPQAS